MDMSGTVVGLLGTPLSNKAFRAEVGIACHTIYLRVSCRCLLHKMTGAGRKRSCMQVPTVIPMAGLRQALQKWSNTSKNGSILLQFREANGQVTYLYKGFFQNLESAAICSSSQVTSIHSTYQEQQDFWLRHMCLGACLGSFALQDAPSAGRSRLPGNDCPSLVRADCHAAPANSSALRAPGPQNQRCSCGGCGGSCQAGCTDQAWNSAAGGVVAIVTGNGNWATGIALCGERTYIVTNAHLLAPRSPAAGSATPDQAYGSVRVQIWPQSQPSMQQKQPIWASAEVLYVFRGPLDLAVLQLSSAERGLVRPLLVRDSPAQAGERIFVIGYPLFPPRHNYGPCMTAGTVSKVCFACNDSPQCWHLESSLD